MTYKPDRRILVLGMGTLAAGLGTSLGRGEAQTTSEDRKSTRLNSSHANISYAVFCLKKKKRNFKPSYTELINYLAFIITEHALRRFDHLKSDLQADFLYPVSIQDIQYSTYQLVEVK